MGNPPKVVIDKIRYSGGQELALHENDTIIFVGPNNAGKSASLREIRGYLMGSVGQKIVSSIVWHRIGNSETFRDYLDKHANKRLEKGQLMYGGIGFSFPATHLQYFSEANFRHVGGFFMASVETQNRIGSVDSAGSINLFEQPPTHPIHLLMEDDGLEKEMSGLFRAAFGEDLIVFRAGGSQFPLRVGKRPAPIKGRDALSKEFVKELLEHSTLLSEQGDGMRSFASVMLHTLLATHHSAVFLDEPEAFLHPPQSRLLGKYISSLRKSQSQLFVATHSASVLEGILDHAKANVRIVRLVRLNNKNYVHEIPVDIASRIATDPLAKYSRVLEGLFYKNVIVTEGDADSLFYNSILNQPSVADGRNFDVLFLHGSGKHRIPSIIRLLRSASVDCQAVVDIDIARDANVFRALWEALGGAWGDIEPDLRKLNSSISSRRPPIKIGELAAMIGDETKSLNQTAPVDAALQSRLQSVIRRGSTWDHIKHAGRSALVGEEVSAFDNLTRVCRELGLWIVPEGEIEGFCRSVPNHGPSFVSTVIETKKLDDDTELEGARQFLRGIAQRLA